MMPVVDPDRVRVLAAGATATEAGIEIAVTGGRTRSPTARAEASLAGHVRPTPEHRRERLAAEMATRDASVPIGRGREALAVRRHPGKKNRPSWTSK
jgi:hypothetical protein